jgi:hypothetical protein
MASLYTSLVHAPIHRVHWDERALPRSPHTKVLDTLPYNKSIATINCQRAATRPRSRLRAPAPWGESNQLSRSIRNSLRNKYFTGNPFNLKDLAELAPKSLIPKDRGRGGTQGSQRQKNEDRP